MDSRTVDPMIGRLVDGRYEVVSRVARGGMATVYRAVDRRLDRTVAVKVMHPHLADSAEFVARFRREARAAARLSHPGVVAVHDQGTTGEAIYLTMEFVDGPNLRTLLRQRGSFSLGESLDLLDAVLDALAAAHRAGLVHRDVKPENVLMTPDGRPKVADFGLARAVSEATAASTGTVLGSVAYLAPEIVTEGVADARADVYACGILLYELLTGAQPFTGDAPIRVAFQHVNDTVPAPSEAVRWLPVEVDDLVAALTARSRDERLPDAVAARDELQRCRRALDPEVLDRRADVAPSLAPTGVAPSATETGDDGDEAPTTVTDVPRTHGTVALPIGAIRADGTERPTARQRRRRPGWLLGAVLLLLLLLAAGALWWAEAGPGAFTVTPDVVGASEEEARTELRTQGLTPVVQREHHDTAPEDVVIATDPAPGEQVRRDGTVQLTVSLGILMVDVPDVVGRDEADARAALDAAGLPVGTVTSEYSDTVPEDEVIRSSPAPGESVEHTTEVDLVVSDGREPAELVDVVGQDREEAVAALQGEGLEVQVAEEHSDDVGEGRVISQSPSPGEGAPELFRGDSVEITVSLGPELVEVPDVVGNQVDDARRALEEAGFRVEVREVLGGFFGTVRSMDPDGGEMVRTGTVVTITVV